jgi:hypothetical protein
MTNEERLGKVHDRINAIDKSVARIYGGIAVSAFVLLAVAGMIVYHINFRFSNIEKTLDKIEKKVSNHQCPPKEIKITSISR